MRYTDVQNDKTYVIELPSEVTVFILGFLKIADIVSVMQVCSSLALIAKDDLIWQSLSQKYFPQRPKPDVSWYSHFRSTFQENQSFFTGNEVAAALFHTVKSGELAKAKFLAAKLNETTPLKSLKDKSSRTLLHWAAWQGSLPMVKWLMDEKLDIFEKDKEDTTPIHLALNRCHIKVCGLFLLILSDQKENSDAKDHEQLMAPYIKLALSTNNLKIAAFLFVSAETEQIVLAAIDDLLDHNLRSGSIILRLMYETRFKDYFRREFKSVQRDTTDDESDIFRASVRLDPEATKQRVEKITKVFIDDTMAEEKTEASESLSKLRLQLSEQRGYVLIASAQNFLNQFKKNSDELSGNLQMLSDTERQIVNETLNKINFTSDVLAFSYEYWAFGLEKDPGTSLTTLDENFTYYQARITYDSLSLACWRGFAALYNCIKDSVNRELVERGRTQETESDARFDDKFKSASNEIKKASMKLKEYMPANQTETLKAELEKHYKDALSMKIKWENLIGLEKININFFRSLVDIFVKDDTIDTSPLFPADLDEIEELVWVKMLARFHAIPELFKKVLFERAILQGARYLHRLRYHNHALKELEKVVKQENGAPADQAQESSTQHNETLEPEPETKRNTFH